MLSKTKRPGMEVLAALFCATTASAQDNRGTPEQRAACAPDAFRNCAGYFPPTRVEHCRRQNKSDLSDACRLVFEQSRTRWPTKANNRIGPPKSAAEVMPKGGRDAV